MFKHLLFNILRLLFGIWNLIIWIFRPAGGLVGERSNSGEW